MNAVVESVCFLFLSSIVWCHDYNMEERNERVNNGRADSVRRMNKAQNKKLGIAPRTCDRVGNRLLRCFGLLESVQEA